MIDLDTGACNYKSVDSTTLVNSLGIGGTIFAGFVVLWFLRTYFRRRMTKNPSNSMLVSPQKTSWGEKRQHPRLAVSWPAQMETSQGPMRVQLKDISLGGAFVVCQNPLPLTEQFHITISAPSQEALRLNAEVVWSNINVPEDNVINRGMGIRFIQNTDENRNRLKHVIMSHLEEKME